MNAIHYRFVWQKTPQKKMDLSLLGIFLKKIWGIFKPKPVSITKNGDNREYHNLGNISSGGDVVFGDKNVYIDYKGKDYILGIEGDLAHNDDRVTEEKEASRLISCVVTDNEQKELIKKITRALMSLRRQERQGFIACKLGLLFLPSGEAAYSQEKKLFKTQNCRLYDIYGDVQFISTDGKMIAFHDCLQQKDKDEKRRNAWIQADQAVYALGDAPAFMELKKEVTDMVLALARRHYMKMPPEARQAIIAVIKGEVMGATAQMVKERVAGTDENITVPVYPSGAKFTGKDGQEYNLSDVMEKLQEKRLDRAWMQLLWCCALVGKKDILSMMAEQEKARKK